MSDVKITTVETVAETGEQYYAMYGCNGKDICDDCKIDACDTCRIPDLLRALGNHEHGLDLGRDGGPDNA